MRPSALVLAAAMAASASGIFPTARAAPKEVVPRWKHDPERLAAAEVKRARKNARRVRQMSQD